MGQHEYKMSGVTVQFPAKAYPSQVIPYFNPFIVNLLPDCDDVQDCDLPQA